MSKNLSKMKMNKIKSLLVAIGLLLSTSVSAYDFEVDGLQYDVVDIESLTVKVVGCNDNVSGEISIPTYVNYSNRDLSVVEIAEDAFKQNINITGIIIGDDVCLIGKYAFRDCYNLSNILFGESVTEIQSYAFSGCKSISSLKFNNKLKTINTDAFSYCTSLTAIEIPSTIEHIGSSVFYNCPISKVNINDIYNWCMIDFDGRTFPSGSSLYLNDIPLTNIEIPNTISEIKQYAFAGFSNITNIIFPSSINKIGSYAFEDCGINSLYLPESLDSIMKHAFKGLPIEKLNIPASVTFMEVLGNLPKLTNLIFEDSENPIELKFGDFFDETNIEVLYVGRPITMNCTYGHWINGIFIMDSYTDCLCRSAFYGLSSLKKVVLGEKCNLITPQWFYQCTNLEDLIIEDGESPIEFYQNIYYDKERPNSWPKYEVQYKYVETFADCPLKNIYLGRNILYTQKYNGVSYPNKRTSPFQNKKNLTNVTIGDFVDNLPQSRFFENGNIKHLEIGKSLTNIPDYSFSGNDSIVSIVMKSEYPPIYPTIFSNYIYINTFLYVPQNSIELYKEAIPWKNFWNLTEDDPTDINQITTDNDAPSTIYDLKGNKLNSPKRGINVINGKKVMIK